MALLKEMISPNGIITNYHKIINITNDNQVIVTVKSYTDESYRQKELDSLTRLEEISSLWANSSEMSESEIQELYKEQDALSNNQDLSVKEKMFMIDSMRDYTFEEAYDYLKTLPEFEGAQDI